MLETGDFTPPHHGIWKLRRAKFSPNRRRGRAIFSNTFFFVEAWTQGLGSLTHFLACFAERSDADRRNCCPARPGTMVAGVSERGSESV